MKSWLLYLVILGFAVYWASNLLLWFPWSYSPGLGMTLMLTISPIIWAYIVLLALKTYPGSDLTKAALIIALIFLVLAVLMDYLFFGLVRNAMAELYHPTTFYGYAFILVLPFLLALVFKKKVLRLKEKASNADFIKATMGGIVCFVILTLIVLLGIEM